MPGNPDNNSDQRQRPLRRQPSKEKKPSWLKRILGDGSADNSEAPENIRPTDYCKWLQPSAGWKETSRFPQTAAGKEFTKEDEIRYQGKGEIQIDVTQHLTNLRPDQIDKKINSIYEELDKNYHNPGNKISKFVLENLRDLLVDILNKDSNGWKRINVERNFTTSLGNYNSYAEHKRTYVFPVVVSITSSEDFQKGFPTATPINMQFDVILDDSGTLSLRPANNKLRGITQ
jgi:hypothetical protein